MPLELDREGYAARYGPTTGDRIRLADTDLILEIERDESTYGDEVLNGWGKTLRTGMLLSDDATAASELDLVITNVVVMDPVLGIFKANIGVKDGVVVGIGRAGNPDVADNVDLLLGADRWVGSLEPGKVADIVLWRPGFFGVKPELVIKGGFPVWGPIGEGNATVSMSEPVIYGPHWGGSGMAAASISLHFVSEAGQRGFRDRVATRRRLAAVEGTRRVTKRNMLHNQANPHLDIDPATSEIAIDGRPLPPIPLDELPLNRRYMLL